MWPEVDAGNDLSTAELISTLNKDIPLAIDLAVSPSIARDFSKALADLISRDQALVIRDRVLQAAIVIPYRVINRMSPEELLRLQWNLESLTNNHLEQRGLQLARRSMELIQTGHPHNILIHEKEHLDFLPASVNNKLDIGIFFAKNTPSYVSLYARETPTAEIGVGGWIDPPRHMSYATKALCASYPTFLSQDDVATARDMAQVTHDWVLENVRREIIKREVR